jgi:methyl-accepting chemotaxis protein
MKDLSLRTKIFSIFGILVSINIMCVVIGLMVSSWMENQYDLTVAFADELSNCLRTKEKVAYLRGEFIHHLVCTMTDSKNVEAQRELLSQDIKDSVQEVFHKSKGCLECHSPGEMNYLDNRTEENLNEFLRVGEEILATKLADRDNVKALVDQDLPKIYGSLQAFLGHGVKESASFLLDAQAKVGRTFKLVGKILFALAIIGVVVAIGGGVAYSHKISRPLREMSRKLKQIASSVLSVATDQSTNASKQAGAIVEASSSAEQLSRAAEALTNQAEVIVQVGERSMKRAIEVTDRMQSTVKFINTVKGHSDKASEKIMSLGQTIDEVGQVLALIEDVASQTRLLAFNASIEAVSAGEAGRRFSVVAKHIKDLAENTSASTDEIKKLIEEIRMLAHTTILSTEQMQNAVDEGVQQVGMAGQAMERIKEVIQENREVAQKINIATAQQSSATEQIPETMEELSKSAQALANGSKQTVHAMKDLTEAAEALEKLIEG